ncbi:MAG: NfeD family protein [Verrucomicrobiales bacterium]|nr:NfeD family protein [Verrucomicrobiales bacterium]
MTAILILSALGIAIILAELVLPGGILGILGALCLITAVILTFVEFGPTAGTISVVILFAFFLLTLGWWMKSFHRLPLTRKLILKSESGKEDPGAGSESLIGRIGTTLTDLFPSGHALIDDEKYDVMAEAESIPKDAKIEVVAERGPSLIVRKLDE